MTDGRGNFGRPIASCSKLAYKMRPIPTDSIEYERSLGFLVADISRLIRRQFDRRVRKLQVTRAQWLFLYYLARKPGCTQTDLADSLQMERISVSRQAERLELAGWIVREDHEEDARAYRLTLTPKARRLLQRLGGYAAELREDYLHGLSKPHRSRLIDHLLHVKTNLLRLDTHTR